MAVSTEGMRLVSETPTSSFAIANWFLKQAWEDEEAKIIVPTMTHTKVQKLTFFAHAWHLGYADAPLIKEEVHAWKYGPVYPALFHQLKRFRKSQISEFAKSEFDALPELFSRSKVQRQRGELQRQFGKLIARAPPGNWSH